MACRIGELVLDARNPAAVAAFWCEVLDFVILETESDGSVEIGAADGFGGRQPTIFINKCDQPEPAKPRLHIDLNPTDRTQPEELERILSIGARPADIGQSGDEPWHVLQDPEGNEFCLLRTKIAAL